VPPKPRGRAAVRFKLTCSVLDSVSKGVAVPRMTVHPRTSTPTVHQACLCGTFLAYCQLTRGAPRAPLFNRSRHAHDAHDRRVRHVARGHHRFPRRKRDVWFFDGAGAGALTDGRPAEFWALADRARGESGSIPVPPSYSYWPSPFPVFPRVDVAKLSDHPSFLPTPRLAFLFIRFRLLN